MTVKARLPLPTVINPAESICVKVNVPNDEFHIAAFWGVMWELAKAYSWENDALHSAKLVADVWKQKWLEARTNQCMDDLIWQMTECGVIEVSWDSGETWHDLPDLNTCFVALAPGSATRNIIIPTGNYPALIMRRTELFNGWINSIEDHLGNFLAGMRYDGALQSGRAGTNGRLLLGMSGGGVATLNANGTILEWDTERIDMTNASSVIRVRGLFTDEIRRYDTTAGIKLGFTFSGGSSIGFGADPINTAMFLTVPWGVGMKAQVFRAKAGQTANLVESQLSDGTKKTGIDKRGELFVVSYPAEPTHEPDQNFTIVGSAADSSLWWFDGGIWNRAWMDSDGDLITNVTTEQADPGEPGSASIDGDTLNIIFPGEPESTMPRIYHSARSRPAAGESDSAIIALDGNGAQALPWTVETGDIIQISNITGWMNDGSAVTNPNEGYRGDGTWYYSGTPAVNILGYVSEDVPPMSILLVHNSSGGELLILTPDLLSGATLTDVNDTEPYALFIPNYQIVPNSRFGNVQFLCTLTANAPIGHIECGAADLETGSHGWRIKAGDELPRKSTGSSSAIPPYMQGGVYLAGVGMRSTVLEIDTEPNGVINSRLAVISIIGDFGMTVSDFSVTFDYVIASQVANFSFDVAWQRDDLTWTPFTNVGMTNGNGSHSITTGVLSDNIIALCYIFRSANANPQTTQLTITNITINCEE